MGSSAQNCTNGGEITAAGNESNITAAGGIVGYDASFGSAVVRIEECDNRSAVSAVISGGICGRANSAIIVKSSNKGVIKSDIMNSDTSSAGGIFGHVGSFGESYPDAGSIEVRQCDNKGAVSALINAGGIGGKGNNIKNCYNEGAVTSGSRAGGICGEGNGPISNSYNRGNVISAGEAAGGIVGYMSTSSSITYCYNAGDVTSDSNNSAVGGIFADGTPVGRTNIANCVSIGRAVVSNDAVGRIVGNKNFVTLANNYAFAKMLGSGSDKTATGADGEDIAYPQISSANFWKEVLGFSDIDWETEDGRLPTLIDLSPQNNEIPIHLLPEGNINISKVIKSEKDVVVTIESDVNHGVAFAVAYTPQGMLINVFAMQDVSAGTKDYTFT